MGWKAYAGLPRPSRRFLIMGSEQRPWPATQHSQARALVATLVGAEALAALLSLAPGLIGDRWLYFGFASLAFQWLVLLTMLGLYCLRRVLHRLDTRLIAATALGLMLFVTFLVLSLVRFTMSDIWPVADGGLLLRCLGISFIVGSLAAAGYIYHARSQELAVEAKQAQLEALRARIRPHFLFNAVNTAIALIRQRPTQAEQLLLDLSDLFRAALSGPDAVTLAQELTLARQYVQVEQLRFGDRLEVIWAVPQQIPDTLVPSLTLQPLLENAIRYGIEPSRQDGKILVEIDRNGGMLTLRVSNPIAEATSHLSGSGVGLKAVAARLEVIAGASNALSVARDDQQFVVTIRLPIPPQVTTR